MASGSDSRSLRQNSDQSEFKETDPPSPSHHWKLISSIQSPTSHCSFLSRGSWYPILPLVSSGTSWTRISRSPLVSWNDIRSRLRGRILSCFQSEELLLLWMSSAVKLWSLYLWVHWVLEGPFFLEDHHSPFLQEIQENLSTDKQVRSGFHLACERQSCMKTPNRLFFSLHSFFILIAHLIPAVSLILFSGLFWCIGYCIVLYCIAWSSWWFTVYHLNNYWTDIIQLCMCKTVDCSTSASWKSRESFGATGATASRRTKVS